MRARFNQQCFSELPKSNSRDHQHVMTNNMQQKLLRLGICLGVGLATLTAVPPSFADSVVDSEGTSDQEMVAATPDEIDSSLTRTYIPTTIYLPDPQTYRLEPQIVPVDSDAPVAGIVGQIISSYEGQEVGIEGYDVAVDQANQVARVNFDVDSERNGREFYSLSSANQVALFESIRETLLTNPEYQIDEIIFSANGESFEI